MKIQMEAMIAPKVTIICFFGCGACRDRTRKEIPHRDNASIVISWNMIPATMILLPDFVDLFFSASSEAMAPPPAWTNRDRTSQVQKIHR
jgi:hypothetical protein